MYLQVLRLFFRQLACPSQFPPVAHGCAMFKELFVLGKSVALLGLWMTKDLNFIISHLHVGSFPLPCGQSPNVVGGRRGPIVYLHVPYVLCDLTRCILAMANRKCPGLLSSCLHCSESRMEYLSETTTVSCFVGQKGSCRTWKITPRLKKFYFLLKLSRGGWGGGTP